MNTINRHWFAVTVPAVIGSIFTWLAVKGAESYGWSLFLGLPLLVSFISAFCTSFRKEVPFKRAYWISLQSILCLGLLILLVALDGLICLIMALPLAILLAAAGTAIGRKLASAFQTGPSASLPIILIVLFPALVAFDKSHESPERLREVTTGVGVNASIHDVWRNVISFPKIQDAPSGVFCCGIAYPIEARIIGTGIGAERHCVFSTGSFVEPITRWEEPSLLAFDVTASPPPLREFSPYKNLHPAHLHGHLVSRHGQFRLTQQKDSILLEGTTWYSNSLSPLWYWGPISDYIIHRVHERVLTHIKRSAEDSPR